MTQRITDRESVTEFRKIAAEYCALIERRDRTTIFALLQEAYLLIPKLGLCAAKLPTIDRGNVRKGSKRTHMRYWKTPYETLRKKLGKHNMYWLVFDPYHLDEDGHHQASLADSLADIYSNVKEGLSAWAKADASARRDIVFTWRLMYEMHWGRHVAEAFRAIHSLLYDHIDADDEFPIGLRFNKNIGDY